MISFVTTRRPPTPAVRRPVTKPAANKVVETNCVPVSETRFPSAPVTSAPVGSAPVISDAVLTAAPTVKSLAPTTQLIAVEPVSGGGAVDIAPPLDVAQALDVADPSEIKSGKKPKLGRQPKATKKVKSPKRARANPSAISAAKAAPASNKPVGAKPAGNKPKSSNVPKRGPSGSGRPSLRTSVHDVARTENMRKRIDQLEASAQNGAQADVFSARTLIAAVIVLLVAALLVPTLRGAIDQSEHIAAQRARLESSQAQLAKLDAELSHWEKPDEEQDAEAWARYRAFIETQARTRINYVRPGDKVWRPVGGDILAEDVDPVTGIRVTDGVVGATAGQSWYHALLESFLVANGPVEDGPTDLNELANRNR